MARRPSEGSTTVASKSRTRSTRREIIARTGRITSWTLHLHVHAVAHAGLRQRESSSYLILEGELTETLNDMSSFMLQVSPEIEPSVGSREMPCVGSVLTTKPRLEAAGALTFEEFRSVLALATSGNLRSSRMAFQKPFYGKALVASMSFHSDVLEDE
jgi:hypothetical protein